MRRIAIVGTLLAAMTIAVPSAQADITPLCPESSITSNFNGTSIPGGTYIWFNSVIKPSGLGSGRVEIHFSPSTIRFSAAGIPYNLTVPGARITYTPFVTSAKTTFANGIWVTTVPAGFGDNVFLAGLAFQVPAGGLPGGINPVTWAGQFATDTPGIKVNWKWAAAVYSQFSTQRTALGVKPVHSTTLDQYHNGDQAGTPENFKSYVIGGARGGGGSNYTGGYSGTGHCP